MVDKGDWTAEQLESQRKAWQAIDAEMNLRHAQIRMESFQRYPEVVAAAADLPEIGHLVPLGGEVTCRAVRQK